ncbi:thiolase family protein [Desulfotruncus alcoholivorax]|uniref:thiolase family protein n=1 Tax=Desulfotruncus alcoholivorax TaxID=265477 RepID=UPI000555A8CB|nr:thiolase family protein [Desulfotruncus alcoholivorax]
MNKLTDAVIVEVVRTPIGKFRQALASFEPTTLAGMTMKKVIEKAGIDPVIIDDVIYANLFNYNYGNFARIALLEAGLPMSVPAITLNRQCISSINAVALAATMIMTGAAEVVMAGGCESYSKQPFMIKKPDSAYPTSLEMAPLKISSDVVGDPPMIITAENLAKKYGITRKECDEFALNSHKKAAAAWDRGFFKGETFPIEIPQKKGNPIIFDRDECVRRDSTLEALGKLKPVMVKDGVVTAGNSSPMNDGASAVLLMSKEKAHEYGLKPLAKVTAFVAAGCDPNIMGIGPVYSTRKLMQKTGLKIDDFDLIELNEAFAAQSIACIKELNIDPEKVNPNGGAIAIGHPNAASGGILTARAVRYMQEANLKRALILFCAGGGQGFSCVLENEFC